MVILGPRWNNTLVPPRFIDPTRSHLRRSNEWLGMTFLPRGRSAGAEPAKTLIYGSLHSFVFFCGNQFRFSPPPSHFSFSSPRLRVNLCLAPSPSASPREPVFSLFRYGSGPPRFHSASPREIRLPVFIIQSSYFLPPPHGGQQKLPPFPKRQPPTNPGCNVAADSGNNRHTACTGRRVLRSRLLADGAAGTIHASMVQKG